MWFRRRRERKAAWTRFSAIADQIGARDGQLISESYMGGLVVPDGLGLTTIRPGSAVEVAQAQLDAAVAAGYTYQETNRPPCDSTSPCGFTNPPDLPFLSMWTFPPGSIIRGSDVVVREGHTGVVISLGGNSEFP